MQAYFVTGTDTSCGKTTVCCHLLEAMAQQGLKTLALKPVATGAEKNPKGRFQNEDALKLQKHSTERQRYTNINPVLLHEPTSPHIAAFNEGAELKVDNIVKSCQSTLNRNVDYVLIEGVGGWLVPLNDHETTADLAIKLGFPVIVVVGLRLGCFSHTLLTVSQIEQSGLPVMGWFANCIDENFASLEDYIESLKKWIPYPMLGRLNYGETLA